MKLVIKHPFISLLLLFIIGCLVSLILYFEINPFRNQREFTPWDSPYMKSLEVGDIVFRTAYGKESRMIQVVSDGEYSHIAVITEIEPSVKVVHATTNDHPELQNQVLLTPIEEFLSADFAKQYLIARPTFLNIDERRVFAGDIHTKIGEPYVLKSQEYENLYCTTLLEVPLLKLAPNIKLQYQVLKVPGMNGDYLFPGAFLELPGMKPLLKDDLWLD